MPERQGAAYVHSGAECGSVCLASAGLGRCSASARCPGARQSSPSVRQKRTPFSFSPERTRRPCAEAWSDSCTPKQDPAESGKRPICWRRALGRAEVWRTASRQAPPVYGVPFGRGRTKGGATPSSGARVQIGGCHEKFWKTGKRPSDKPRFLATPQTTATKTSGLWPCSKFRPLRTPNRRSRWRLSPKPEHSVKERL